MSTTKYHGSKRIIIVLIFMTATAFVIFSFPNAAASENIHMIQMFEPDEAAPLPAVFDMIAPADSLDKALRQFIFYEYYFYGFPYFALSALVVLPLYWLGQSTDLPSVMLALRQFVSVLPALLALLLLVYMQDRFRTYRSIVLFAVLLSIPAILHNNFWWHPDGIVLLLAVIILFLLWRDNLRFGRYFYAAAFFCGALTAAKIVGVFFFLSVGLTLLLGLYLKKISWKKFLGVSATFAAIMAVSFVMTNPFLLSSWGRIDYWNKFKATNFVLSEGYGIVYQKGLAAAWPLMHQYYGSAVFILLAILTAIWGAVRGPNRLLHAIILAWWLPLTVYVLTFSHFKFQYWMPVAMPLFSSLVLLLPEKPIRGKFRQPKSWARAALVLTVLIQTGSFIVYDVNHYNARLHRAENNPRIEFYNQALLELAPISGTPISVYYDYRLYVPETDNWRSQSTMDLLDYSYIEENHFDVLLLLEQRIRDYTHPDATGIDTAGFVENQEFYRDALNETIAGYHLLYRNDTGLMYVRDELFMEYLTPQQ